MCNANGVSIEFFPAHFQVKDLSTGVQLLQGRTKNELYEWPVQSSSPMSLLASSSQKPDLLSWHARLGHPALSVLYQSPCLLQTICVVRIVLSIKAISCHFTQTPLSHTILLSICIQKCGLLRLCLWMASSIILSLLTCTLAIHGCIHSS